MNLPRAATSDRGRQSQREVSFAKPDSFVRPHLTALAFSHGDPS